MRPRNRPIGLRDYMDIPEKDWLPRGHEKPEPPEEEEKEEPDADNDNSK